MVQKSRVGDGIKPFGEPLKNGRNKKFLLSTSYARVFFRLSTSQFFLSRA